MLCRLTWALPGPSENGNFLWFDIEWGKKNICGSLTSALEDLNITACFEDIAITSKALSISQTYLMIPLWLCQLIPPCSSSPSPPTPHRSPLASYCDVLPPPPPPPLYVEVCPGAVSASGGSGGSAGETDCGASAGPGDGAQLSTEPGLGEGQAGSWYDTGGCGPYLPC